MNAQHQPIILEKPGTQWFYPWVIWVLGASFFFYKYLVQVSPSVMTHDLMAAFNVHGVGLGNLSACYFYAYLLMQIPVGILLDKYSPRYLTTGAILLCGLSTFLFSETNSLAMACIARALIGFGAAFAAVSCFKAASLWFPAKRFALISGMYMTAAMLGAVGGQAPLSLLVQDHGWRSSLKIIAIVGVILSVLYVVIVRDKQHVVAPVASPDAPKGRFWLILKNKQAWLLSIYSGLAFAPVSVFGGLWGVPFLQQTYLLSASQAAVAVSWIFIGFAVGAPLLGWWSDRMNRRKPMMMFGTLLALLSLMIVIYSAHLSVGTISTLLFLFGFGASGFFISFAMIRELFPLFFTATVLGFMNTFDSVCEAISEPFVGIFLDLSWDGRVQDGVHQFSSYGYKMALTLLPLYLIVAFIVLIFIKETYCKSVGEEVNEVEEPHARTCDHS
jgi:MFS family permease